MTKTVPWRNRVIDMTFGVDLGFYAQRKVQAMLDIIGLRNAQIDGFF